MTEEQVPGTMVSVDTLLWNDPYEKRGEVGIITRADISADDFYVRFEDGSEGLYAGNSLRVLKDPEELWKMVTGPSPASISQQGKDDIQKIALLLQYGGEQSKRAAYQKIAWNDNLEFFATSTLEYALGMKPSNKIGR